MRISYENRGIINRIRQVSPSYNIDLMEQEFKQQKIILKNICEKPYVLPLRSNSSTKSHPEYKVSSNFNLTVILYRNLNMLLILPS